MGLVSEKRMKGQRKRERAKGRLVVNDSKVIMGTSKWAGANSLLRPSRKSKIQGTLEHSRFIGCSWPRCFTAYFPLQISTGLALP